jgi:proline iminopeptidase
VVFLLAAYLISSVVVISLMALAACFGISTGQAQRSAKRIAPLHRYRIALGVGSGTALLVAIIAALTIFAPLIPSTEIPPPPTLPAQASYWQLSTGSKIAYLKVPAQGTAQATPVIFLHGGPGAYAVTNQAGIDYFEQLAQLGYDVYFYDQVGGGLSSRLKDVSQYTLERHVADLDAIISQQIKAEKVILIGQSWGGTLAANYMAVHPQRVAKAIFSSPAPINYTEWRDYGKISERLPAEVNKEVNNSLTSPRLLLLMSLAHLNLNTARDFVSERELDGFFDRLVSKMSPGMVCDPAHLPKDASMNGFGFWSSTMTQQTHPTGSQDNPRELLATNQTPALVLTGECNYIKWEPTYQYRTTLPNSTLLYFEKAGHVIYYDQPDLYFEVLRNFLQEKPLPLPPYQGK